jgi:hypothetical protein
LPQEEAAPEAPVDVATAVEVTTEKKEGEGAEKKEA